MFIVGIFRLFTLSRENRDREIQRKERECADKTEYKIIVIIIYSLIYIPYLSLLL